MLRKSRHRDRNISEVASQFEPTRDELTGLTFLCSKAVAPLETDKLLHFSLGFMLMRSSPGTVDTGMATALKTSEIRAAYHDPILS
jgi:hypothetical protein